jgi:hypothetical protein
MELDGDGRLTILPPRPSPSRMLLARVIALWFGAAACLRRLVVGLVWHARTGLAMARVRWAPALRPPAASSVPELRLSERLACLREDQPLCLADAHSRSGVRFPRRTALTAEKVTRTG